MKLIPLDALVAEIERRKQVAFGWMETAPNDAIEAEFELCDDILSFINSLEVKEVYSKKELSLEDYESFFKKYPDLSDDWGFDEACGHLPNISLSLVLKQKENNMTDKIQKIREEIEKIKTVHSSVGLKESNPDILVVQVCTNLLSFIDFLQEEPVSIWHDSSEMPKEKKVCLIRYSANDGASTNNFEVVIAEPLTRRFVTRSYPHKTGYQHTIHGETTIKVDEYQDRREKIPFSDIDEWAYIDDLLNINL